jgi:hypothetical protein
MTDHGPLPHVRYRTAWTMPAEKFEYGYLSRAPQVHRLGTYVSISSGALI